MVGGTRRPRGGRIDRPPRSRSKTRLFWRAHAEFDDTYCKLAWKQKPPVLLLRWERPAPKSTVNTRHEHGGPRGRYPLQRKALSRSKTKAFLRPRMRTVPVSRQRILDLKQKWQFRTDPGPRPSGQCAFAVPTSPASGAPAASGPEEYGWPSARGGQAHHQRTAIAFNQLVPFKYNRKNISAAAPKMHRKSI